VRQAHLLEVGQWIRLKHHIDPLAQQLAASLDG
jgi:hypothetical protein